MPRWEYRYLREVLRKDRRLEVTFLMTQGDAALAATSPQHIARFPQDTKTANKYDLIILGDVPSRFFKAEQLRLIETLVKERGSSLLMVALIGFFSLLSSRLVIYFWMLEVLIVDALRSPK